MLFCNQISRDRIRARIISLHDGIRHKCTPIAYYQRFTEASGALGDLSWRLARAHAAEKPFHACFGCSRAALRAAGYDISFRHHSFGVYMITRVSTNPSIH